MAREDLLILVNVAPSAPYPELFSRGPMQTWFGEAVSGVRVMTFHGQPVQGLRRDLSDLRMMLKFPLSSPAAIGTVDSNRFLMRGYQMCVSQALGTGTKGTLASRSRSYVARRTLVLASRVADLWDRKVTSYFKNRHRARVRLSANAILVGRGQTVNNSMAIRMDILKAVSEGERFKGIIFVTASAYVDQRRLLHWIHDQPASVFVAGSNALPVEQGEADFISGFFTYFSWDLVQTMAVAKDFDHSLPDDGAISKWLNDRGIPWIDPGIEWETGLLEKGVCPMCADPRICVVRCTSHGARHKEAGYMRLLHHDHDVVASTSTQKD